MSEQKRKVATPYARLLKEITEFCSELRFRHEATMCSVPKSRLGESFSLNDVWERTMAAEQLGYEVHLVADDSGLRFRYKKKGPMVPYEWRDSDD